MTCFLYLCTDGWLGPWVDRLWWRTTILPLACCHIERVASPLQQSLVVTKCDRTERIVSWRNYPYFYTYSRLLYYARFSLWFWLHLVLYWCPTLWSLVSLSVCTSSSRHKERHFYSRRKKNTEHSLTIVNNMPTYWKTTSEFVAH